MKEQTYFNILKSNKNKLVAHQECINTEWMEYVNNNLTVNDEKKI